MPKYIYLISPNNSRFDDEIVKKSRLSEKHTESMPFTSDFQAVFLKTDQIIDVDVNQDKNTDEEDWREARVYIMTHVRQRGAKQNDYYRFNPDPDRAESRRF